MKNICPVCGYDELLEPPYDEYNIPSYEICPCCGFEYGFDDQDLNFDFITYREKWLLSGAKWVQCQEKPDDWNLDTQLKNLIDSLQFNDK